MSGSGGAITSAFQKHIRQLVSAASVVALSITTTMPAFANSSSPNPPPTTPTPVITSPPVQPQLSTVGAGGCTQQYVRALNTLGQQALDANYAGLGTQALSLASEITAVGAEGTASYLESANDGIIASFMALDALGVGGTAAAPDFGLNSGIEAAKGVAATAAALALTGQAGGLASSIAGVVFQQEQATLNDYVTGGSNNMPLPFCDSEFTGTVKFDAGVNVTGNSIFQNNLGVVGNVNVGGNVTASQVRATQGISAMGGAITLGDLNGTTYSSGITLGGGALSGAGFTGNPNDEAFTGDVTAIAIGNRARATEIGSLALGLAAIAEGINSTAIGNGSQALANSTVAIGDGAMVANSAGPGSFAGGTSMVLGGYGAVSIGNLNVAAGNGAVAIGDPNLAVGTGAVAMGDMNTAIGNGAVALGDNNTATGQAAIAQGQNSTATGPGATALGQTASATAPNAIAIGTSSTASAANSTALGDGAKATGVNSTAIGAGATASLPDQIVFGTSSTTITMPGMNSDASRARQSGLLGVVTSDTYGNLASDNGALYKQVARVKSGAAVAMALADPILAGHQQFGLKLNWGGFDGANAAGLTALGVVGKNLLTTGDQLSLSGGVGWGQTSVTGYSQNVVGGHAGLQLAW